MAKRRYGAYRGRNPAGTVLKLVVILVAIVLAIMVAALAYFREYLVFDEGGIYFSIPATEEESVATPEPSATPSIPLVVVTPTPTPYLYAVELTLEDILAGDVADKVEELGGNAALFDMKADSGMLGYLSQIELAKTAKTSSGDATINGAIETMNGEDGLYTIARVSCFKDNMLSNADSQLNILSNSGYRWVDIDNIRWADPTGETVWNYIADVCVELAQLGFDEIVLENGQFPEEGQLGYIKKGERYDATAFTTELEGFYQTVTQALEPYPDVTLSILTDGNTITLGENTLSGMTVDILTTFGQRVWVNDWVDGCVEILSEGGLEDSIHNTVVINDTQAGSWAMCNP